MHRLFWAVLCFTFCRLRLGQIFPPKMSQEINIIVSQQLDSKLGKLRIFFLNSVIAERNSDNYDVQFYESCHQSVNQKSRRTLTLQFIHVIIITVTQLLLISVAVDSVDLRKNVPMSAIVHGYFMSSYCEQTFGIKTLILVTASDARSVFDS